MDGEKYTLSDDALLEAINDFAFTEIDPLFFLEGGEAVGGFWGAAQEVVAATGVHAAKLMTGQARAMFYMRSFYMLGMLRGAEAYRFAMMDEEEGPAQIPFSLDSFSAEDFREDLERTTPEMFQRLCALLGLTVQWKDRAQKPRRRKR